MPAPIVRRALIVDDASLSGREYVSTFVVAVFNGKKMVGSRNFRREAYEDGPESMEAVTDDIIRYLAEAGVKEYHNAATILAHQPKPRKYTKLTEKEMLAHAITLLPMFEAQFPGPWWRA